MSIRKQVGAHLDVYRREYGFSGVVLVAKGNRVCFEKGYGYANVQHKVRNRLDTRFRIGSITKQFTAFGILALHEQGKLKLDDRLEKYIPGIPNGRRITLHHMLTHTSGMECFTRSRGFWKAVSSPAAVERVIKRIAALRPHSKPGKEARYINSAYFLLGHIIELVSGCSYEDFLAVHLFGPLGMDDTGMYSGADVIPRMAGGYRVDNGITANDIYIHNSWAFSAGGLYSTALDLYTWSKYLMDSRHPLLKRVKPLAFKKYNRRWGYGMEIWRQHRRTAFGHGGLIGGFESHMLGVRSLGITVIGLGNRRPCAPNGYDLLSIALGEKVPLPKSPKACRLPDEWRTILPGKYTFWTRIDIEGDTVVTTCRHPGLEKPWVERWYPIDKETLCDFATPKRRTVTIDRRKHEVKFGPLEKVSKTKWWPHQGPRS